MSTGSNEEKSQGKERMEGAWQQVTAYIVQLEKRLNEMELNTSHGSRPLYSQSMLVKSVPL